MGEEVKAALLRAAWEYGKLGLLVDDSAESSTRLARAIYCSEALPRWWMQVCSLDCACKALEALEEILRDSEFGTLRGLVVIDRYLPLHCGGGKAIPWDWADYPRNEKERAVTERLRERVGAVKSTELGTSKIGPKLACHVLFVTSFPAITARTAQADESAVKWQTRSVELLQEERRKIQKSDQWNVLLRFGPEEAARIKQDTPPKDLLDKNRAAEAKWRARTWRRNIERVAQLLKNNDPVILLTGAGASLAVSPTAPGMPSTHRLLQEACERVRKIRIDEDRGRGTLPDADCACQARSAPVFQKREEWKRDSGKAPIDWLVDQSMTKDGVAGVDWKLEILFSRDEHDRLKGKVSFDDFHNAFRDALHRWDFGVAFQHWILARLRWSGIVTTNFDAFHERATAEVVTLPWLKVEDRLSYLSRGMLVPIPSSDVDLPKGEGRLFKPYGNLYSSEGTLALDFRQIESFQKFFRRAFVGALKRGKDIPGALVVVGHSMRDDSICRVLEDNEEKLRDFELLWVDPSAYERCSQKEEKERTVWERWIWARVQGDPRGGPVPATALEFLSDLWARYQEL